MSNAAIAHDQFFRLANEVVETAHCPTLASPLWWDRYHAVMNFFTSPMGLKKREMLPRFRDNREFLDRKQALCLSDAEWIRFQAAYDARRRFDRYYVGIGRRRAAHRRKK